MQVAIVCMTPNGCVDGPGELEECEEIVSGGFVRRQGVIPNKKHRRLLLKNKHFKLQLGESYPIIIINEDIPYLGEVCLIELNSSSEELEWVICLP